MRSVELRGGSDGLRAVPVIIGILNAMVQRRQTACSFVTMPRRGNFHSDFNVRIRAHDAIHSALLTDPGEPDCRTRRSQQIPAKRTGFGKDPVVLRA
jgi:hypothetical protein